MAITIHQHATDNGNYTSGFNEIIYVVSSSNSGQANFQYVCDIYLTDDTGALTHNGVAYLRTKTPADPVYSSGVFNIKDKIRSFLSYDIGNDTYGWQKSPNSIIQIVCKFGEEYGASSAITVYPNLATGNTAYAFNASIDPIDALDYNYTANRIETTVSQSKQALTNRPSSGIVRVGEDGWVYYSPGANNAIFNGVIQTWKSNGVLQQTYYINNSHATLSTVGQRIQRFPAGVRNLEAIPKSSILSGQNAVVINSANVSRYEIFTVNASSGITSASQWYKVDDTCTEHTIYRLHFLNKLGGFDSFSFIRAHTFETEITRDTYKRNMITRIGGGKYGYNKSDASQVQYNTKQKDTIKVISDWVNEATLTWLEELVSSPVVFHDDATEGRLAIVITDTKFTRKQELTDKLFNLEVTFQYSHDRYRQSL